MTDEPLEDPPKRYAYLLSPGSWLRTPEGRRALGDAAEALCYEPAAPYEPPLMIEDR